MSDAKARVHARCKHEATGSIRSGMPVRQPCIWSQPDEAASFAASACLLAAAAQPMPGLCASDTLALDDALKRMSAMSGTGPLIQAIAR